MRNDKEFKAKNRDTNFSKEKSTDTIVERYGRTAKEDTSVSERNKRYRQSENETVSTEAQQPIQAEVQNDNTEIQTDEKPHTVQNEISSQAVPDIPKPPEPKHTSVTSAAVKQAVRKHHRHNSMLTHTADNDNSSNDAQFSHNDKDGADENKSNQQETGASDKAPKQQNAENDKYDFTEEKHKSEKAFDRVDGNTDFQLGGQSETVSHTETKPSDEKKQTQKKAIQKKRVKEDKSSKYDIQEAVSKSETAFERTEPKEDFSFGKEHDYAFERDKSADIPQRTDVSFERKKSDTENKDKRDTKKQKQRSTKRDTKTDVNNGGAKAKNGDTKTDDKQKKKKSRLKFEDEKKPRSPLYKTEPAKNIILTATAAKVHSKVSENEDENVGVEAAHSAEKGGEAILRFGNNTRRSYEDKTTTAKAKRQERLKFEQDSGEAKAGADKAKTYEKSIKSDNKKKSAEKKQARKEAAQKKTIKKNQQQKNIQKNAERAKKIKRKAKEAAEATANFVKAHWKELLIVLAVLIVFGFIASTVSSCSVMFSSGFNSIMTSSYFAEDEDIYAAEDYYKGLESNLQSEIDNIERTHSGYDEYKYNLAQIGHNPYELISYLTAAYMDFTFEDIKAELDALFSQQYILTLTEETETRTDDEGNEKEYRILNVTLENKNLNMLANTYLDEEQRELYGIYLESKGNRDYLFADDIYSNTVQAPTYTIPGAALSDATFRRLITEAERYLGYPYVWGGSSPSTSFDCSGFVCWVFQNSGVYPLSRTTAQGIYNQCAIIPRSQAKPGDIIFFTGTYNAGEPVTHVGIYVGDGMMIHCGNPIQYASIDSSYWTQHFYAIGRLGN